MRGCPDLAVRLSIGPASDRVQTGPHTALVPIDGLFFSSCSFAGDDGDGINSVRSTRPAQIGLGECETAMQSRLFWGSGVMAATGQGCADGSSWPGFCACLAASGCNTDWMGHLLWPATPNHHHNHLPSPNFGPLAIPRSAAATRNPRIDSGCCMCPAMTAMATR